MLSIEAPGCSAPFTSIPDVPSQHLLININPTHIAPGQTLSSLSSE
jgi:hypothetical protein